MRTFSHCERVSRSVPCTSSLSGAARGRPVFLRSSMPGLSVAQDQVATEMFSRHNNTMQTAVKTLKIRVKDKLDMVARWYMVDKDGMATLCTDREDAEKEAEYANMAWPHTAPHRAVQLVEVGTSAAELHPSPPEGMVGGWRPIETAPKDSGYILLRGGHEQDVASGYWLQAAYAGNGAWIWPFVHMTPRFLAPLPPTTSAGSGKGE